MTPNPFEKLPLDLWQAICAYLSPEDMRALALTCQLAGKTFSALKGGRPAFKERFASQGRYLSVSASQPTDHLDIKKRSDLVLAMALPVDGQWLFVVHQILPVDAQSQPTLYFDIYQRKSLVPLKYDHIGEAKFPVPINIEGQFIVGLDNTKEKPGIFFVDQERNPYSYHLGDQEPTRVNLPPNFLENTNVPCAINGDKDLITVYRPGTMGAEVFRLSREGVELGTRSEYKIDLWGQALESLTLSPNGHSLLLIQGNHQLHVIDTRNGNMKVSTSYTRFIRPEGDRSCPTKLLSITDDGRNIFDGTCISPVNHLEPKQLYFDVSTNPERVAHSGNGNIVLHENNGKITRLHTKTSRHWAAIIDAFHWIDEIIAAYSGCEAFFIHFASSFINNTGEIVMSLQVQLIRKQFPIFDANTIARLSKEFSGASDHMTSTFFLIANCLWAMELNHIEQQPEQPHNPVLTALKSIAASPLINALRNNDPSPRNFKTESVGIVTDQLFLQPPNTNQTAAFDLVQRYAVSKVGDKKQILFNQINVEFAVRLQSNSLIYCISEIKPGMRVADAFCLSRNPRWDKKFKKLIPKNFSHSIQANEVMRNFVNLDAVLLKLITWMTDGKAKQELEAARQRMLQAVRVNPSLQYDPTQLWHTPFFGKASLDSCVKDPAYRNAILASFKIPPNVALELAPDHPANG